ncbi:MAG: hypothetical protein IT378_24360 [Sandaracinaceae bacterium]|nr:hypothetical protein [Sandaracinaceae bacterium]
MTYKLAWTHYRADRYAQAILRFDALLGSEERQLASESATYIAMCISEPDWDGDGADDPVSGLARPEAQAWLARTSSPVPVLRALVEVERDQARCEPARAALRALAARDPSAAAEVEPTLARCATR